MKIVWCGLVLLLQLVIISSLTAATISGKVVNAAGSPIVAANVVLLNESNTLIKTEVTTGEGQFELLSVANGEYYIIIIATGYKPDTIKSFSITGEDVALPPRTLSETGKSLKEVTIQAQKPLIEIHADKLVVNVENSIVNTGASVFEVLGRSPGVLIDQSENINLKGKPGVMVMMNGKRMPVSGADLANILKGTPSSSIEKIEIITNPGARYDAAGSGGIINIVTKKDKRIGLNGTLNATYSQGVYRKGNAGCNLNYRDKKLNVNLNYNYSDRHGFSDLDITREFYANDVLRTKYTQQNHLFFPVQNHTGGVALDYNLTSKTTAGVSANFNSSHFTPKGFNTSRVDSGATYTFFTTANNSKDNWNNYALNAYVKHTFDTTGRELSADIDYAQYWNQTYQVFTNKYTDRDGRSLIPDYILYGDLRGKTEIRSVKVDYTHPFKNGLRIDAGIKASYVTADNKPSFYDRSSGNDILDTAKSNHFLYTENINAGYINASEDIGKWSLQLGLRGEQTIAHGHQLITGDKFNRNYFQLFPSLAVQRHISDKHDLGITLSRRIDRPDYRQLNPFKYFLDPTNYRTGNPYLNPTLTYSAELSHTLKKRFITTLTTSIASNVITETLEADAVYPNISKQTDKNLASMYYYGISCAYPIQITKWWSNTVNGNAYYSFYSGSLSNTTLRRGRPAFDINTTNSFTLPKGFSAELSFYYQSRMYWGFYDLIPVYNLNAGIQKSLLNKKATIKVSYTDILWSNRPGATIVFNNFTEVWKATRDSRIVNLSFIYRIGKGGSNQRRHTSGADDEKKRVGGAGN
ncbi:MAG: outer membrane beta-barrel protein [Bacteroidota bacterium]